MSEELKNLSQEIRALIEAERQKAIKETIARVDQARNWFARKWWLGWTLLGFVVGCAVLWGITR
ncbi:MAG: hypothetical protein WHT06_16160 [Desulfobacterales bacterium]